MWSHSSAEPACAKLIPPLPTLSHDIHGALAANFIFGKHVIDFVPGMIESQGSLQVKSHSEKDIWDQVREAERRHGDQAEAELAKRIHELTARKQFEEASFWSAVAARLQNLHDIKLPGPTILQTLLGTTDGTRVS